MERAFGGRGFASKVLKFFSKRQTGPEKRILDTIPDLDPKALASEVVEAFMDSPLKSFFETDIPDEPDKIDPSLGAVAEEAQEAEEEQAEAQPSAEEKRSHRKMV